jgi:hypothetical protein
MPFGIAELCDRGVGSCPVRGCGHGNPCPDHHLRVRPTPGGRTYVYDDPYFNQNLLWADTDDRRRLDDILRGKRESRMGHEHSEDAVTWNVFRFFERHACLSPAIKEICPCPTDEPLTVFWTTHNGCLWEPYRLCSEQLSEKASSGSESDLIFLWPQKLVVVVEAKFRSANRSDMSKRDDELRKSGPYIERASGYFNREGAYEAVRDGWYELLRNWALGAKLRDALACETFVLVNLVRSRHGTIHGENPRKEFAERACLLSSTSQFAVAYWEDLIASAPSISDHPDTDVLVRWAKNKSELLGKPAFDF